MFPFFRRVTALLLIILPPVTAQWRRNIAMYNRKQSILNRREHFAVELGMH
jgi:hypothetical protein